MAGYSDMAVSTAKAKAKASGSEKDKKIAENAEKAYGSNSIASNAGYEQQHKDAEKSKDTAELISLSDEDLVSKRNSTTGDEKKKYQDEINKRDKDGKPHFWQKKPESKNKEDDTATAEFIEESTKNDKVPFKVGVGEDEVETSVEEEYLNNQISDSDASTILADAGIDNEDAAKEVIQSAGGKVRKVKGPNGAEMWTIDPTDMTREAWAEKYGKDNGKWQKIATLVSLAASYLTSGAVPPINFMMLDHDKQGYEAWLENVKHDNDNWSDLAKDANTRSAVEGTAVENKDTLDTYDNQETERLRSTQRVLEDETLNTEQKRNYLEVEKTRAISEIDGDLQERVLEAVRKNDVQKLEDMAKLAKEGDKETLKYLSWIVSASQGDYAMTTKDKINTGIDVVKGTGEVIGSMLP